MTSSIKVTSNTDKIIFIRHNFNDSKYSAEVLQSKKLIAIHFTEQYHQSFDEYTNPSKQFRKAYNIFKKLGDKGGLVVIQYDTQSFYIGEINHGTPILPFNVANENEPTDYFKTISISKLSDKFFYADYPLFSAIRPPFATIATLNENSKNWIDHLYYKKPIEVLYSNLHPKMLEQMCEEWLRSDLSSEPYRIKYGLLKTGKTLPVIDIYAETKQGKYLCVQVTLGVDKKKLFSKLKELSDYISSRQDSSNIIGLFISDENAKHSIDQFPSIEFLSARKIFDDLQKSATHGNMVSKMMGIVC